MPFYTKVLSTETVQVVMDYFQSQSQLIKYQPQRSVIPSSEYDPNINKLIDRVSSSKNFGFAKGYLLNKESSKNIHSYYAIFNALKRKIRRGHDILMSDLQEIFHDMIKSDVFLDSKPEYQLLVLSQLRSATNGYFGMNGVNELNVIIEEYIKLFLGRLVPLKQVSGAVIFQFFDSTPMQLELKFELMDMFIGVYGQEFDIDMYYYLIKVYIHSVKRSSVSLSKKQIEILEKYMRQLIADDLYKGTTMINAILYDGLNVMKELRIPFKSDLLDMIKQIVCQIPVSDDKWESIVLFASNNVNIVPWDKILITSIIDDDIIINQKTSPVLRILSSDAVTSKILVDILKLYVDPDVYYIIAYYLFNKLQSNNQFMDHREVMVIVIQYLIIFRDVEDHLLGDLNKQKTILALYYWNIYLNT